MTTREQDEEFVSDMIGMELLDNAVEWISKNLKPEDVFTDSELEDWALDNGYVAKEE